MKALWLIGFVASVALGAAALQLYPTVFPPPPPTKTFALRDIVPAALPGWRVREVALADTEEMKAVVNRSLQFDDHLVRAFERGSDIIVVYIAYWGPGKMPYRMVGAHSPDTCWVQNGWVRAERARWTSKPSGETLRQPIEWGVYTYRGLPQHVIFWHMVGDETYAFDQHGIHNPLGIFHDFLEFGLSQRREQFFIRVSSNRPWEDMLREPDVGRILANLWKLGSAEKPLIAAAPVQ